jgi:hypothetical protein
MTKRLYILAIILILTAAALFDTTSLEAIPTGLMSIGILLLAFAPLVAHILEIEQFINKK